MGKLFWVSLLTLSLLFSFVWGLVMVVLIYLKAVEVTLAIGITIVINLGLWIWGPWLTDQINRIFYKVEFIPATTFATNHPTVAALITQVAQEYNFKTPRIGMIPDQNPTAFTYGSHRSNARIILTEGLFTYLSETEVKAVIAHELGHIVNRDFMVMMVGSTLVQILYEIYASLSRSSGNDKGKGIFKTVGLFAYIFYLIGIYLLYYLSRTREYLADRFALEKTSATDLARALIKIAYGIVAAEDTVATTRLLHSTRHLGVIDVKHARNIGVVTHLAKADPQVIAEVMAFDLLSPWAQLAELSSTHPLTGKRLLYIDAAGAEKNEERVFDLKKAAGNYQIDKGKMWGWFWKDLIIMALPWVGALIALILVGPGGIPGAVGIAWLISLAYRYPPLKIKRTTLLTELRNPYASPLRGIPVEFAGKVMGRGTPGYVLGEDLMFQDPTGLIYLNYISAGGFVGDLFFALKKVKALMGVEAVATGWFFRGLTTSMTLKSLQTNQERIAGHPKLWMGIWATVMILMSLFWILF